MHAQYLPQLLLSPLVQSCISVSSNFDVLGPFQIGTREVAWSTDILGSYGGFRSLKVDENARFHSSIAKGGFVGWSKAVAYEDGILNLQFDSNVNWQEGQSAYGWAGLQFQAWARGSIWACRAAVLRVYASNAAEVWIDDKRYIGDMYGFETAPVVVSVKKGLTKLEIKVAGDIRATGGGIPPRVSVQLEAMPVMEKIVVDDSGWKIPETVNGVFAGPYGSIAVRNEGQEQIEIVDVVGDSVEPETLELNSRHYRIFPGQTRPIKFKLNRKRIRLGGLLCVNVIYKLRPETAGASVHKYNACHSVQDLEDVHLPHVFTYLHKSGIVSHGIIRPPSQNSELSTNTEGHNRKQKLPVLLMLHGSGVDVRKPEFRDVYQDFKESYAAWVVMPSGATPWAGDDWHIWGTQDDAYPAIEAIKDWMEAVNWTGELADPRRVVITGHSNGGQGAWHAGIHNSDNIVAIAPLSGFSSIQTYVPYSLWHPTEPQKQALVDAAMNSHRLELLTENLIGLPILHQHGDLDDNVPPFHSRLLSQTLAEHGWEADYQEVPGRGHWWEGVMTEGRIPEFLAAHLKTTSDKEGGLWELPKRFSVVVGNPADHQGRGGIWILQLRQPNRLGRIDVSITDGSNWKLKTSNVRRFKIGTHRPDITLPASILIDGQRFERGPERDTETTYLKEGTLWKVSNSYETERSGKQLGPMEGILRTDGPYSIILPPNPSAAELHYATEIARGLFLYLGADSEILDSHSLPGLGSFQICISITRTNTNCRPGSHPTLDIHDETYTLHTTSGEVHIPKELGSGVIHLAPSACGRNLSVWIYGSDEGGFRAASALLPYRTGAGVPDFVVTGTEAWRGVEGVRALGFWDSEWKTAGGYGYY